MQLAHLLAPAQMFIDQRHFFIEILDVFIAETLVLFTDDNVAAAVGAQRFAKRDMDIQGKRLVAGAEGAEILDINRFIDRVRPHRRGRVAGIARARGIKFKNSFSRNGKGHNWITLEYQTWRMIATSLLLSCHEWGLSLNASY